MNSFLRFWSSRFNLGVICIVLLAGAVSIPAGTPAPLVPGQEEITLTLRAPQFELARDSVRLLSENERYTSDQPEGQPLLPHRSYTLGLPPDADLTSLELVVADVLVENQPGSFQFPLAEAPVMLCEPQEAEPEAACSGQAAGPQNPFASLLPAVPGPRLLNARAAASPEAGVRLLSPGQMRKWRFARLDFAPFHYTPQDGRLSVVRSVTATIRFRRDPGLVTPQILADSVLDGYAPGLLDNFSEVQAQYALESVPKSPTASVSYLILTTTAIRFNSNLEAYATFLREHGQTVLIEEVEKIGGNLADKLADRMRAYLQANYMAWGLKYVLLVGDPDPYYGDVPMRIMFPNHLTDPSGWREIPTDSYYSNLTGNWDLNGDGFPGEALNVFTLEEGDIGPGGVDFTPSVFVGRIPVYNDDYATLNSILAKTMAYQSITRRQSWQDRALLPMVYLFGDYDAAVFGYMLAKDLLTPNGISSHKIFMNYSAASPCNQVSTYAHDEDMAPKAVVNYWSANPVGLMVWAGHGSPSSTAAGWGDGSSSCWLNYNLFNSLQAAALDDTRPAFTFHFSCVNGYPEYSNNVAYSLLAQGAVATVAATRNTFSSGYDSEAMMPTTTSGPGGIGYNYVKRLTQGYPASEALALMRTLHPLEKSNILDNLYGYNLYGDPLSVFYVPPLNWIYKPAAPTNLAADPLDADGHQPLKLRWTDNSELEEYFRITMTATDLSGDVLLEVSRNSIAASVHSSAVCTKTYNIIVQAVNRDRVSDPSNTITVAAGPCPPAAPSNLTAALNANHVQLNWKDNSPNEAGFRIFRQLQGSTPVELAGQVAAHEITFLDTSETCNQTYTYFVAAYNAGGVAPSESIKIKTGICLPSAPVVHLDAAAQTSLSLGWTDANTSTNAEDGFEVWSQAPLNNWKKVATLPADTLSYVDSGLLCGTTYLHMIVAFNAGGHNESAVHLDDTYACTQPAAPSGLAVNGNLFYKTEIHLKWVDNSNNEQGFIVQRETSPGIWVQEKDPVGPNVTSFVVTDLACGNAYTFRVLAATSSLLSDPSTPATGSTAVCDEKSPINFKATVISQNLIDLSWDPAPGTSPISYDLIRPVGLSPAGGWETMGYVTAPNHTFGDRNLTCGTTYTYSVRSVFAAQSPSLYTAAISATTLPCTSGMPGQFKVIPVSPNGVVITWLPPAWGELGGFYADRMPTGGRTWERVATLAADATFYEAGGLACGTSYDFRLQAFNSGGTGDFSAVATVVTDACAPAAPSGLTPSNIQKTSLSLSWTDHSSSETGFSLERSGDAGATWAVAGTTATDITSFDDSGLTCGTPYAYRVAAFNTGGQSAPSAVLETLTKPCNPIFNAVPGPEGLVSVGWSDPGQRTTRYVVQRAPHGGVPDIIGEALPDVTSYRDLNVACGTVYDYFLVSVNPSGESDWPTPVVVNSVCTPNIVISLAASNPTTNRITLTWTASAGGQDGYVLMRSRDGSDGWVDVGTARGGETQTFDTGLMPGTRYFYRLRAFNTGGEVISAMTSATTLHAVMLPVVVK